MECLLLPWGLGCRQALWRRLSQRAIPKGCSLSQAIGDGGKMAGMDYRVPLLLEIVRGQPGTATTYLRAP